MRIKRYIYFILCLCLSINAFALELNRDLKTIIADGKLTVAFVPTDSSNYVYYGANQQLQGFDVEIAQRIAKALSIKLVPVIASNYDEAIALVANKKAELAISNITATYERGKYVLFSQPYNKSYFSVIENRQNANAIDLTRSKVIAKYNQPGIKLGVIGGTTFTDIAAKYFPKAIVTIYNDPKQILKDVADKNINAALVDSQDGKNFLKQSPQMALSVTVTQVNNWALNDAIVMDYRHLNLMLWINLFLETLEDDGTLKEMRTRYFEK